MNQRKDKYFSEPRSDLWSKLSKDFDIESRRGTTDSSEKETRERRRNAYSSNQYADNINNQYEQMCCSQGSPNPPRLWDFISTVKPNMREEAECGSATGNWRSNPIGLPFNSRNGSTFSPTQHLPSQQHQLLRSGHLTPEAFSTSSSFQRPSSLFLKSSRRNGVSFYCCYCLYVVIYR